MTDVAANLEAVRAKIAAAAVRSGRDPAAVALVAVSKTRSADEVAVAAAAGVVDLGENYVQEMAAKAQSLGGQASEPLRWHFIGHLQRNKVKHLSSFCALIHSVDSPRVAVEVGHRAGQAGRLQPILLQVDLAGEATKDGCPEAELPDLVGVVRSLPHVDWQGLMTIAPLAADPQASRPYYQRLVALRDGLAAQGVPAGNLRHLSMGMSDDYEVAIEEGATLVRVGTAIFGPRH